MDNHMKRVDVYNSDLSEAAEVLANYRYSGEVGEACQLIYDLDTCKFNETESHSEFDPTTDF
jgi:hypothetical protein